MEPLASKIRPKSLREFVGQRHLVGRTGPLRRAIEDKHLFSFILWGPPGVGKTTLARIYARAFDTRLYELSAVAAGKDEIKKIIDDPDTLIDQRPKILFLDEIHRFNKAQQDFLLPAVESGKLTLIGATTENPSFEVIAPLLSRCRVFVMKSLSNEELKIIIKRTGIRITEEALKWLVSFSNGDARIALTAIENTHRLYGEISKENLEEILTKSFIRFYKKGDEHYDTISAFIKSLRASDVDAAIYYLVRMIEGGADPKFIARRMIVFASEDVGLAAPTALVVANEVFEAVEKVGLPEGAINLVHGAVYLALAKKDRSVYEAFRSAQKDVHDFGNLPIPLRIRNASTKLMETLGYGQGYEKYPSLRSKGDGKTSYLPEKLKGKKYWRRLS
jgi:putative ATPase